MSNNEIDKNEGSIPSINAPLGAPQSNTKAKSNVSKLFYLVFVLVGFLFMVFGLLYYNKHKIQRADIAVTKKQEEKAAFVQKNTALSDTSIDSQIAAIRAQEEKNKADAEMLSDSDKARAEVVAASTRSGTSSQVNNQPGNQAVPPSPHDRKLSGSALFNIETENKSSNVSTNTSAQNGNNAPGASNSLFGANTSNNQNTTNNPDSIASKLQPTVLTGSNAGHLPNLTYLLKRNKVIPCALKTGIDTTLSGFVVCNVISDVYSADGKTLLIARHAEISGEQQSSLKQGQARVFVLWTRIDNPDGTFAELDSPATDAMGFNGIGGYVDTHFKERFGAAILISLIKDVSDFVVGTAKQSTGNNSPSYSNTTQGSTSVATEAIKSSVNIPPTLTVNPATIVNVLVARDINFASVYTVIR